MVRSGEAASRTTRRPKHLTNWSPRWFETPPSVALTKRVLSRGRYRRISARTESIVAPISTIKADIQNHSSSTMTAPSEP